jgi:hypothetical protein
MRNSPNRLVATVFGAVYLLVGLVGFVVTSGVGFVSTEGANLIVFEINPLHNVIHLAIGAALLYAGVKDVQLARTVNTAVGAVYLLVGIVGLFLLNSPLNIIALNGADNVLHLASAVLLLGVGLSLEKVPATARA